MYCKKYKKEMNYEVDGVKVMKIVNADVELLSDIDQDSLLKHLECYGRVCYKSESKITDQSANDFIHMIIKNGHESVLEHEKITFKIICDRGVSHELVRHRIASFSQESTRYCNYSKDRFGNELTFIKPCFWDKDDEEYKIWEKNMQIIEENYNLLISQGAKPEEARSILPNSLKTEIVITMNIRELRYFLKLRTSAKAHPQMREVTCKLLQSLKNKVPVLFEDIKSK